MLVKTGPKTDPNHELTRKADANVSNTYILSPDIALISFLCRFPSFDA